jgi:hypothetical protein
MSKKKLKLEKQETHYTVQLDVSEYDYLNVVEDVEGRIKISFRDQRWRTVADTVRLLMEIVDLLNTKPSKP